MIVPHSRRACIDIKFLKLLDFIVTSDCVVVNVQDCLYIKKNT